MNTIDFSRPVKLKHPQHGEENLLFKVTTVNEVTNRCYIKLITPLQGINMNLAPQELVSMDEIEMIK